MAQSSVPAQAYSVVTAEQVAQIVLKVSDDWDMLGALLDPYLISVALTKEIYDSWPTQEDRAKVMMDKWMKHHGIYATQRKVISVLCDMTRRHHAIEIFGEDLVQFVKPKSSPGDSNK